MSRIVIVDDDLAFATALDRSIRRRTRQDLEVSIYSDPAGVREDVERGRLDTSLIYVLDHDLGQDEMGVGLAGWLLGRHPGGRGLRFIYLTGRLSDEEFRAHRQGIYGPIHHYFHKTAAVEAQRFIATLLQQLAADGTDGGRGA